MSGRASLGAEVFIMDVNYLDIRDKTGSVVRQPSIEDGIAAVSHAFESDLPSEPVVAVSVTTPSGAVDDEEAGWDSGDLPAGLSGGGEQPRAVFPSIRDIVGQ